jgi:hypothetical protein
VFLLSDVDEEVLSIPLDSTSLDDSKLAVF